MLHRKFSLFGAWLVFTAAFIGLGMPQLRAQTADHVNIATNAEPDTLDMTVSTFPPISYVILRNVHESLWEYNNDGSVRATVADWERSPDGLTLTFQIHPGVKFQSGNELTADDVVFSFERMKAKTPSFMRHARLADKIEAVDRYTVRITYKQPDVTLFEGTSLFLADKAYFDKVGEKEAMQHPSGLGPYKIAEYRPGQYVDLVAHDGYYGPKPAIKSARFYIVKDEQTRVAKLRAGEVDIIMNTPYTEIGLLEKAGFTTVKFPANPTVSVIFDTLSPQSPWHKRDVREAIAHAIDADAIVKGLFGGVVSRYPMLAPGELGYDPAMKNYAFDPKLAKKMLADAGYPNGFKMPLYYSGTAFYGFTQATEAVSLYLKAVGIDVEPHNQEAFEGLSQARKAQLDPSIELVTVGALPIANTGLTSLDMLGIAFYSIAPSVVSKFPEVDDGIARALRELDDTKRGEIIKGVVGFLHEQVATITLWDSVSVYSMKPNVHYTPIEHRMPFMLLRNVSVGK